MSPTTATDAELIRQVQEAASRALPAEHVERLGGWWLRHTASRSWWAGSVQPHADTAAAELTRRVDAAERFYAGFGARARFQIAPPVCPADLDPLLARHGYTRSGQMALRTAAAATVAEPARPLPVSVDRRPSSDWSRVWRAANGRAPEPSVEESMYERVNLPSGYAAAELDGEVVAVGRAVADSGWAGVFSMATLPEARGRGAARSVLTALASWAAQRGVDRLYLQVEADNHAATRLYEGMGFATLCEYHYRIGPA